MNKVMSLKEEFGNKGIELVNYSSRKDPVILFMSIEREDNNKFVKSMTEAVLSLDAKGIKITPKSLSKASRYSAREIELNLHEIVTIMDALGLE